MSGSASPPMLQALRRGIQESAADPAYADMIDTLRGFLDQLAMARPDEADILALDEDLQKWTARLAHARVEESERMFSRIPDVPGHGQVMCPAFAIDAQDETSLHARVTFGDYFLGANGAAHGGSVALLFDEILGIPANNGVATMARTAYLHVNYRSITPINRELQVTARVASVDGRKRIVRGELRDGERLCADAEGLFLELLSGQQ
jgi:acyl-coenzyme A thioesterase PaaI-like protein